MQKEPHEKFERAHLYGSILKERINLADRLKRVQGSSRSVIGSDARSDENHPAKRQKKSSLGAAGPSTEHSSQENSPTTDMNIVISDEIMIGDWVIFDLRKETIPSNLKDEIDKQNGHLIGLVIGFRVKDKKNRTLQYKSDFVSLSNENKNKKNIIVIAVWYTCNEDGLLNQLTGNLSIGLESYKRTMKSPIVKSGSDSVNLGVNYILPFQYSEIKNL